jgi:hypothetical protein
MTVIRTNEVFVKDFLSLADEQVNLKKDCLEAPVESKYASGNIARH